MKKWLIFTELFLLSLILIQAKAQAPPFKNEHYPFVKKEFNKIDLYGNDESYKKLFERMEKAYLSGQGQVNIVHFGGSHIQADGWTDRMRSNLNNVVEGISGPRGFIFPYTIAKTNNPYAYKVDHSGKWEGLRNVSKDKESVLGAGGISASTVDSTASFKITFREGQQDSYYHTRLKVYYHFSDSSYEIKPITGDDYKKKLNPEDGFIEFAFPGRKDTIELELVKTDSMQNYFTLLGLKLENDEAGVVYHSIGVNGASVPSYNRCQLLAKHVKTLHPDLVIFSIGINDANDPDFSSQSYEANYDTLIRAIRSVAPECAILLTTNTDCYYKRKYPNKNGIEVRRVMINLAEKYNGGIWDIYNLMGGLGSIKKWESKGMAKRDLIHLTPDGYRVLGDLMFNAMMKSYTQYRSGKP